MNGFLEQLAELIEQRKREQPAGSYTVTLLNNELKAAQKVGEEGVEVVIAALNQSRERLLEESADLLYHLLVLLTAKGVTLSEVEAVLEARHK
jgi:phosphoribosyl-ATP pyrophosphohydrolase